MRRPSIRFPRLGWLLGTYLTACDQPLPGMDAGGDGGSEAAVDVSSDTGARTCRRSSECSDGLFCNGVERCVFASGATVGLCAAATSLQCLEGQTCNEDANQCVTNCTVARDADGDGHLAMACGGDDCDDADRLRFPGNPEVCDDGHDEDCNPSTFGSRDVDGDGFVADTCCNTLASGQSQCGTDCNDQANAINPNAVELCDSLDNNCDGVRDEGVETQFYPDVDRDSFGDRAAVAIASCVPPPGTVANNLDCNDTTASASPIGTELCDAIDNDCDGELDEGFGHTRFYRDMDRDSYGVSTDFLDVCVAPAGYVPYGGDCADNDPRRRPGLGELCDGVDNDCDGDTDNGLDRRTYYRDQDGDLYGDSTQTVQACALPNGYAERGGDCVDTTADNLGVDFNPAVAERCNNQDDDCDGATDEDLPSFATYQDLDGDGFGTLSTLEMACSLAAGRSLYAGDCDDNQASVGPTAVEICDGLDNDCNGVPDSAGERNGDLDRDGYWDCAPLGGTPLDCNDDDEDIHVGAPELCNLEDDDCDEDGTEDEGCPDNLSVNVSLSMLTTAISGASVETETFVRNCPAGTVLMDIQATGMMDVSGLRLWCQPVALFRPVQGAPGIPYEFGVDNHGVSEVEAPVPQTREVLDDPGLASLVPSFRSVCFGGDGFLTGLTANFTTGGFLRNLLPLCTVPEVGREPPFLVSTRALEGIWIPLESASGTHTTSCPANSLAIGIEGSIGMSVEAGNVRRIRALQLRCAPYDLVLRAEHAGPILSGG